MKKHLLKSNPDLIINAILTKLLQIQGSTTLLFPKFMKQYQGKYIRD